MKLSPHVSGGVLLHYGDIRFAEEFLNKYDFSRVIAFDTVADELEGVSEDDEGNGEPDPKPGIADDADNEGRDGQDGQRNADHVEDETRLILMPLKPVFEHNALRHE